MTGNLKKVTGLDELSSPANGDLMHVVDVSDTTHDPAGTSKKISLGTISTFLYSIFLTALQLLKWNADRLQDIDISTTAPTDNQVLTYDEATSKWIPAPAGTTSPLTTKGDLFGFDTTNARIPVGTNDQVLTADSTAALGVAWKDPTGSASPLTTKGDLFTYSTVDARLPLGTNGQKLVVDTTQTTGIKWQDDYIGINTIVTNETPTGTVNGTNTDFTSANAFLAGSLSVKLNGQEVYETSDYTLSGQTVTFLTAPPTGSTIRFSYQKSAVANGNAETVDGFSANSLSNSFIYRQGLINGNCQVNQGTITNLTSGKLFGSVDMFYAKGAGTAVSAGTITQTTTANCGNSGYALKLSGVTLTGTGLVYAYTFIESINAKLYKNKTASFSVNVYHDVGSAINYTIKINKANSADNFSAITNIVTGSATSVSNTTATTIKLENISLGDCSNGIEVEISAACGAITTKNFEFTDWQFNEGSLVLSFVSRTYNEELNNCLRYYELVPEESSSYNVAGNTAATYKFYKVTKRIAGTPTYKTNPSYSNCSAATLDTFSIYGCRSYVTVTGTGIGYWTGGIIEVIARPTIV